MSNEPVNKDQNTQEETTSIDVFPLDLLGILWRWKKFIIIVTLATAVGVGLYSLISIKMPPLESYMPNKYTSEALILIDNSSSGGRSGFSSQLRPDAMGDIPSLGLTNTVVQSDYSELAIFLIKTNTFLDTIVEEFNVQEKYRITEYPIITSREVIKNNLVISYNERNGVLSIGFTNTDPVYTRDIANFVAVHLINRLNELIFDKDTADGANLEANINRTFQDIKKLEEENQRLERSAASSPGRFPAIMMEAERISMELTAKRLVYTHLRVQQELASIRSSERSIFQILEMAETPQRKSGPYRGKLCMTVTLIGFLSAVFLSFVFNAIIKIKNNPKAIAILTGRKYHEE